MWRENDNELNKLLLQASVPDRQARYWDEFPKCVVHELQATGTGDMLPADSKKLSRADGAPVIRPLLFDFFAKRRKLVLVGAACFCMLAAILLGVWAGNSSSEGDLQMVSIRKCFSEIESLFPNQVQSIAFDNQGPHLVLADRPDVPAATPLYVRICGPAGCQRFVTFSGQKVQINADTLEVLLDHQGQIMLVGPRWVWTSGQPVRVGGYRIEAKSLAGAS
ncbi:MAG: hypothetical protein C5B50_12770 [Verrucomicrobia bacterium]|nr:MAG: hypothetical protein C5B50_12770 [Verrucomicrobiota bacterium]